MRGSDWNKIKEKLSELHNDLEAKDLVEHLYEKHVFTADDKERIMHEATRKDKAIKLLDILRNKELPEGDVYEVFLSQLRRTQPHLADMLKPPGTARRQRAGATQSSKGRQVGHIQSLDTDQLCEFLAPLLKNNKIGDDVLKTIKQEKVNGRVFLKMDGSSMKEVFPFLKYGERTLILMERDEFIEKTGLKEDIVSVEHSLQEENMQESLTLKQAAQKSTRKGTFLKPTDTSRQHDRPNPPLYHT
uniref:Caspase-3-like protein n=1 Tax=Haliotis diversicolor TaxID=36095 RepID=S5LM98_HALDV|nr:caspase-3-like protein [Haliotis diversicolor]